MSDKLSQRQRHVLRELAQEVRYFSKDNKSYILDELAAVDHLEAKKDSLSLVENGDRIYLKNRLSYSLYKLIKHKPFMDPCDPQEKHLFEDLMHAIHAYLKAPDSEKEAFRQLAQSKPSLICRNMRKYRNIMSNREHVID